MSWMNWLSVVRSQKAKGDFPYEFDIPPGDVTARVCLHSIETAHGQLSCWSYVTNGLATRGQKEVILTVACEADEATQAFPSDPLQLFGQINQLTLAGDVLDVGGTITFDSRNLILGRHVMFIRAQPLQGVDVPGSGLAAILVTQEEVFAAIAFGVTRVMARLGFASRYYPCPPWSSRRRFGISLERMQSETVLASVSRKHVSGARVVQEGPRATIRCTRRASTELAQCLRGLQGEECLALLTDLDPTANGCFVWEPGQSGPGAITPPHSDGSRLSACFALFVPHQPEDETKLIEDGVGFILTASSWSQVHQALLAGENLTLASKKGGTISIEINEG
jgi:hypothetical protein